LKSHYAFCLGTFSPKKAEKIKRLIYEGGKSRTVYIVLRGRSPKKSAPRRGRNPYAYSLPKRYANKYALYVRPRPKVERIKALAERINQIRGDRPSSSFPHPDVREMTRIIKDLKRMGYSKIQIVKMLGGNPLVQQGNPISVKEMI